MEIKFHHFDQLTSTNSYAKEVLPNLEKGVLHLIWSNMQTHGRGRFERRWVSPKGNLFCTFCLSLPKDYAYQLSLTTLMLATVVCQFFENIPMKIKWPNDLLIEGKKCGGILGETVQLKDHVWLILGLGLNLNLSDESMEQIDQVATSLHLYMEEPLEPKPVVEQLAKRFTGAMRLYLQEGFSPFFPLWEKYNAFKEGQDIEVETGQGVVKGRFKELQKDGSITLVGRDGQLHQVM